MPVLPGIGGSGGGGGGSIDLSAWNITNGSTDRAFDADSTSLNEIADALYTLVQDINGSSPTGLTLHSINNFRLTLTSGTSVTTSDVTGATTIYFTPHNGSQIGLYDGAAWQIVSSAEVSLALGTLVDATNYDVFAYSAAGVLTLELLAWTNDTTRATALVRQDGVWSKTGALTRRYVGTIRTTATTTTEDSEAKRFLFNADNRAPRTMLVRDGTDSWTYNSTTWRSANNSTANRLQFVLGLSDAPVVAHVHDICRASGGTHAALVGVGLDSTTADSARMTYEEFPANIINAARSVYEGLPVVGFHFLQWLEQSSQSTTFWGDAGNPTLFRNGIWGTVWA